MTLDDLEKVGRDYLNPLEVAEYLHVYHQQLRKELRSNPDMLGIHTIIVGKRIKIPKAAFINFMRGEN